MFWVEIRAGLLAFHKRTIGSRALIPSIVCPAVRRVEREREEREGLGSGRPAEGYLSRQAGLIEIL